MIETATPQAKTARPVIPLSERPHALYRFYDATDSLLYIGITAALPTWLMNHDEEKPWWTTVTYIKIEHLPNRVDVLAAEKLAIETEHPRWNKQHNAKFLAAAEEAGKRTGHNAAAPADWPRFTFRTRHGFERTGPLWLHWEVHCDPISDDYYVDDITPDELWRTWLTCHPSDEKAEATFGPGAFRIWWFIEGSATFEAAPFQDLHGFPDLYRIDDRGHQQHFLSYHTWPSDVATGEPLQWSRLPVIDKIWRDHNIPQVHTYKGGFITEATGWKPAPLQPYVNIRQLGRAAGLYVPPEARP